MNSPSLVLQIEEVAEKIHKSVSWVYRNAASVGGKKIAGSWFFTEEGVKDAISRGKEVPCSSNNRRTETHKAVRYKKGSAGMGIGHQKESEEAENPDRHGFASALQSVR
jgi:hypothetical protein